MTIRFTCPGCGSLLKIKDQLAGTDGKCPKCKTEFVVPEPADEEHSADAEAVESAARKRDVGSRYESTAKPQAVAKHAVASNLDQPAKRERNAKPEVSGSYDEEPKLMEQPERPESKEHQEQPERKEQSDHEVVHESTKVSEESVADQPQPSGEQAENEREESDQQAVGPDEAPATVATESSDDHAEPLKQRPELVQAGGEEGTSQHSAEQQAEQPASTEESDELKHAPHERDEQSNGSKSNARRSQVSAKTNPSSAETSTTETSNSHSAKPGHGKSDPGAHEATREGRARTPAADEDLTVSKPRADKAAKPPAKTKKAAPSNKDDFDPAEFLMSEGSGPKPRPLPATFDDSDSHKEHPAETRSKRPTPDFESHRPTARSQTPQPEAGGNASSFAREMMMRAMENSRAHAGDMPIGPERPGFDFVGMFRELVLKGGGGLVLIALLAYGAYLGFEYLLGTGYSLPKLAEVSGIVTLDGQPLANATVYFEPDKDSKIEHASRERPRTSMGITDAKGQFTMIYLDKIHGVAVGKCRVWLSCIGDRGQLVPADHTEANLLFKDVPEGKQKIDFSMKSHP